MTLLKRCFCSHRPVTFYQGSLMIRKMCGHLRWPEAAEAGSVIPKWGPQATNNHLHLLQTRGTGPLLVLVSHKITFLKKEIIFLKEKCLLLEAQKKKSKQKLVLQFIFYVVFSMKV